MAHVAEHVHRVQEQVYHVLDGDGLLTLDGERHVRCASTTTCSCRRACATASPTNGTVPLVFLVVTSPVEDDETPGVSAPTDERPACAGDTARRAIADRRPLGRWRAAPAGARQVPAAAVHGDRTWPARDQVRDGGGGGAGGVSRQPADAARARRDPRHAPRCCSSSAPTSWCARCRSRPASPPATRQGELRAACRPSACRPKRRAASRGEMVPLEGAPQQAGRLGFTLRVPLGVVCAITPFNAPLNTVAHKVAPALAAGNAVVLKPSTHTPTPANLLAEALLAAGLPPALLSVLHGGAEIAQAGCSTSRRCASSPSPAAPRSAREIQQRAGLRRTQMELGSIAFTVRRRRRQPRSPRCPRSSTPAIARPARCARRSSCCWCSARIRPQVQERLSALVRALPFGDPAASEHRRRPGDQRGRGATHRTLDRRRAGRGAERLAGGPRRGAVVPADAADRASTTR